MVLLLVPTILRAFRWKAGLAAVVIPGPPGCVEVGSEAVGDVVVGTDIVADVAIGTEAVACVKIGSEAC